MIMVRHFQEEEALPALPDLPKAVKVASYFILECEVVLLSMKERHFFSNRLALEKFFDGKLWFCKGFPKP